jgi:hypothetical protein
LNKDSRRKYDEYLIDKVGIFNELKESFNKTNVESYFPDKDVSKKLFNNKIDELNKKHGYNENNESIMDKFNLVKDKRNNDTIKIEKEHINDMDDFNMKFNSYKTNNGKFKNQIIEYSGSPSELSTYIIGENYTNLNDLDKLYIEDSVQTSKYSSLDRAFMLQPSTINYDNKTCDEKIKEYEKQTDHLKINVSSDSSKKKFNEW